MAGDGGTGMGLGAIMRSRSRDRAAVSPPGYLTLPSVTTVCFDPAVRTAAELIGGAGGDHGRPAAEAGTPASAAHRAPRGD